MGLFARMSRRVLLCATAALSSLCARNLNPVKWSVHPGQQKAGPGSTVVLLLQAQIAEGYHLYSFTTPKGGPIKTTASVEGKPGFENVRVFQPKPNLRRDPTLNVSVETFENGVDFVITGRLSKKLGDTLVTVSVRYQACSNEICLPPVTKTATTSITVQPGVKAATVSIPSDYQMVTGAIEASKKPSHAWQAGAPRRVP